MRPPLPLVGRRVNVTLHGRSQYRKQDVPGHNIWRGYNTPGYGDGIDLFCAGGTTVRALEACRQTRHYCDGTKKEVIYLEGAHTIAVYAHIDARKKGTGHEFAEGEVVGSVLGTLRDPHLHFELELKGSRPMGNRDPQVLLEKMMAVLGAPKVYLRGSFLKNVPTDLQDGKLYVPIRAFTEALGFTINPLGGDIVQVGDPSRTRLRENIKVETRFLDEPQIRWVRATDILNPALFSYDWRSDTRMLFIL